jgi:Leucine-rich repeat (LRR) protein
MTKKFVLIILLLSIIFPAALLHGAIPASERAALIAIYNSTGGDDWKNNSGWKTAPLDGDGFAMPGSESGWYGVTVTADKVKQLYLLNNGLSGSIPPEIGDLAGLSALNMSSNSLSGSLPAQLFTLTGLTNLNLSSNSFSNITLNDFLPLTNLNNLEMSSCNISGAIPAAIANLADLSYLLLNNNNLSGSLPPELGNMSKLSYLWLSGNNITGAIPPEMGNMTQLSSLNLNSNSLGGTLPAELGDLAALKSLQLSYNHISGVIPNSLGNLSLLITLNLANNQFYGSIPGSFGNLVNLKFLTLDNNWLSGSIPAEIGNLAALTFLHLNSNSLGGAIPPQMGNLSNLMILELHFNYLSGSIPGELGNLDNLMTLNLKSNQLTGTIPTGLGNMDKIQKLYLSRNKLTGNIPEELTNLSTLQYFYLGANNFVGQVPASVMNLTGLYYIELSLNGFYNTDGALESFLAVKSPYWKTSQTIAPSDVSGTAASTTSVTLNWTPIEYSAAAGSYRVYAGASPGSGYSLAAETGDKTATSVTVTGLNPDTTYYFVIQTRTAVNANNKNEVLSHYSPEISVKTPAEAVQEYQLTVGSSPAAGVPVTVSPGDTGGSGDGQTTFTRTYAAGTPVTLTAPAGYNGQSFSKWTIDGANNSNRTVTVTMDSHHTLMAVYETDGAPGTYTLTVQSTTGSGAAITVTPADNNGGAGGTIPFSREYDSGTVVTLTAPDRYNGQSFSMWTIDGANNTNSTVTVTMDSHHTLTAVYETGGTPSTYTLTVQSTSESGAAITITPADNNGNGSETTPFSREYDSGTLVTLTAPAKQDGQTFSKWTIDGANNTNRTVTVTMDGDHTVRAYYIDNPGSPSRLVLARETLNFGCIGASAPPARDLRVTIDGGPVDWSAASDVAWIQLLPSSGSGTAKVSVTINPEGLSMGKYTGTITVTAPDAENSPQTVTVTLIVYAANSTGGPTGDFSTPIHGSTVYSSVPVTGWVVDDLGVESVKIYREGANPKDLIFIGDAVFVEGARPDIEALYPEYPDNYRAGWGYMLLTHFLPGGGNGTFTLHAVALDIEGNKVTLGTKTITVDNANAVKPFGAIDTPGQGGAASGARFVNWGWALTPQPNMIPGDGSTIDVWVDGVKQGHPVYNIYRSDIAKLFPGYANSDGAIGYFYLDTELYEDGVHTIQWTVSDNAGNTDGIGSRYFTIDNAGLSRRTSSPAQALPAAPFVPGPIRIKKGYMKNTPAGIIAPDQKGRLTVEMKELGRIQVHLEQTPLPLKESSSTRYYGYLSVNGQLRPLPAGSFLDIRRGIFYWQPGVAFSGPYTFEFITCGGSGEMTRKSVTVNIGPRFNR